MNKEELFLSVERHATSKLPTDDLFNINFLGFRGEALASIGAVSHLKITTKAEAEETGLSLEVNAGKKSEITPTAHAKGTLIQMRDLFYNLPARLKFLKSDISELLASKEVIYKIALAYPEVSFTLFNEKKKLFFFPKAPSLKERARDIIDASFMENTLDINATRDGMTLKGFISIPTYTRATSKDQYFIVNGRAIKDKMLYGILKAAYQGLLFQGRFPIAVLYLDIPHQEIDMNVHPAKTEVRFQKEASVRGLLIGALKQALATAGHRTSTTLGIGALENLSKNIEHNSYPSYSSSRGPSSFSRNSFNPSSFQRQSSPQGTNTFEDSVNTEFRQTPLDLENGFSVKTPSPFMSEEDYPSSKENAFPPLGFAKAQIQKTYIISQTQDGFILVDQHASHERLTYEKLQKAYTEQIKTQLLLIPEVVDLTESEVEALCHHKEEMQKLGFSYDRFGQNAVMVREIPALLRQSDIKALTKDIAEILEETKTAFALKERIKDILASMSCHGSIRAGRELSLNDMNALLREMEQNNFAGECIHGRPTYIELKLKDIEKLFNRS